MKLVYTHENRFFVNNAKNIIEAESIPCFTKNEFAAGGVGDLAPLSAWLELWLLDENDYDRALSIIQQSFEETEQRLGSPWTCPDCKESNAPNFKLCWSCDKERSGLT